MKYWSLFMVFSSILVACSPKTNPSAPVTVTPTNTNNNSNSSMNLQNITYLALGDSYTIGESVNENERYPNQLADSLKAKGFYISELKNIARTGWTTDELKQGIDNANIQNKTYDMVSLLIGVNNQYRGRNVEQYKLEFTNLLNDAIKFANGKKDRVFVVSIPDYAYTPFGGGNPNITKGIDEYNAANEAIAKNMGVLYINITPISREGLADPSLVANDKLHPSGGQYTRWVRLMLPQIASLLK